MTRTEKVLILRNSKVCERRVMTALGGRRHINDGHAHSDSADGFPFAVEITRSKAPWRHAAKKWAQCLFNARAEGRPALYVQAEPRQRVERMLFTCEGELWLEMYRAWRREQQRRFGRDPEDDSTTPGFEILRREAA